MKNNLLYFALLLVILSSCSRKSYTALYHEDAVLEQNETTYNLSKNLLKLEIIYTLNEPRVQKNGVDEELTTSNTKITIEDPIKITKLLVADPSQTFVLKGKQLPDTYFKKPDEYENVAYSDAFTNIPTAQVNDADTLSCASLTDSNKEAEAYGAVLNMLHNISRIKTKQDATYTLGLVSFYKDQFTMVNEDYKPYVKKSKVKYTVIIDPLVIDLTDGNWADVVNDKVVHTIFPTHIFEKNAMLMDTVTLVTPKLKSSRNNILNNQESIEGVVYRNPSSENIEVKINDFNIEGDALQLDQFGSMDMVSVDNLKKEFNPNVVLFKSNIKDQATIKYDNILSLNDTVEVLNFNSNDTVETSQNEIRSEYEKKLKNIDLLVKRLNERKAEL